MDTSTMMFRPMIPDDLDRGFVTTLSVLKPVDLAQEKLQKNFQDRNRQGCCTYVLEENNSVVATATAIYETKFYNLGRKVAHIEDVAVHAEQQGRGLGKMIMEAMKTEAVAKGCYKMILDCSDKNIPFYEKCGYKTHETQMRIDLPGSNEFCCNSPRVIKPMTIGDIESGFPETLSVLKPVDLPKERLQEIFVEKVLQGTTTWIIENDGRTIATATVIYETKFYNCGKKVAHIEDVAVHADHQGRGLGKMIMEALKTKAVANGCYKIILDCSSKNIPFYEKNGYKVHETQMRMDLTD